MQKSSQQANLFLLLISLFLLILSGCNIPQAPVAEPTTPPEELSMAETEAAEPTPTATPEPDLRKVILISGPETDPILLNALREGFHAIPENQLKLVEAETVSETLLDSETDYVILPQTPADLGDYSQKFPEIQFITISQTAQAFSNVWTIRYDPGFEPFLSGYAMAVTTYDWRSAGLIPNDIEHREETFLNGAQYFCGRCLSSVAPYITFPLIVSLPSSASPEAWESGIDQIQSNYIYSYYISPEAASEALFEKFKGMDATLIGANDQPEGLDGKWLATIRIDLAGAILKIISGEEMAAQPGEIVPDLLIIPGSVGKIFHSGKEGILQEVYRDLLSGLVSPYDPQPPASFEK